MKRQISIGLVLISIVMIIATIIFIDFPQGYYCDVVDYNALTDAGCIEYRDLPENGYEIEFRPKEEYLTGFQMVFTNVVYGELCLSIYEVDSSLLIEEIVVNLEQINENEWYRVYLEKQLERGRVYKLHIDVRNGSARPCLLLVDGAHLSEENISGNMLIGYAYKKPLFTVQEKILISIFALALGLGISSNMIINPGVKKKIEGVAIVTFLIAVLTQNYMYNSIDNKNQMFRTFQEDSEILVTDVIWAERNGIWFQKDGLGYGLGKYNADTGILRPYKSQYGLQGKVFRHVARYMEYDDIIPNLSFICSMATATVLVTLVWLLSKKYNIIFAGCFYVTFWLSPWIVNFARNLYWVEFTWFLPMLIGLFCAWKVENKKCRVLSYILAWGAITIKCLCGYEYISCIMLGLIAFLLVDFIVAVGQKDKRKQKLLFKTIFGLGLMALAGFLTALCIHAQIRGMGNVADGLRQIYEMDAIKRTSGGDFNEFQAVYWDSFNASTWKVMCLYFHFPTEIITGVGGNLFAVLIMVPLVIFFGDWKNGKLDVEMITIYVMFFITTMSWHVLAKSHSYIHTHMNYVLWYFGFIQSCCYIIIDRIMRALHLRKGLDK